MATLEQVQEIANRGLEDQLDPERRAKFDEMVRRNLIRLPQTSTEILETPTQSEILALTPQSPEISARQSGFMELLDDASRTLENFTSEALNTATFGLSDIVAGTGRALGEQLFGGEDKDPARAFNVPRERREQFREDFPVSSGIASFTGGFLNPAAGPAGLAVSQAKGVVPRIARSTGVGAGFAGGQAAGEEAGRTIGRLAEGQDIDLGASGERVLGATVTGAAIGAAMPKATDILGALGKKSIDFFRKLTPRGQETRALLKVSEALEADGFTPQQALERVQKMGPEAALIDAGPKSRALAAEATAAPGAGSKKIVDFLRTRQEGVRNPTTGVIEGGQVNRIQNHIDDLIKTDFFTEAEVLANKNLSGKLYESAYKANQQVESPLINRILKTNAGRGAMRRARVTLDNLMKNLSKTDPELAQQLRETGGKVTGKGVGKGFKLEFLDQVKQELWTLEQLAKDKFGKATSRSNSISELRRALTKELDRLDVTAQAGPRSLKLEGGDYARARLLAGDKLANQEALEKGATFLSKAKFSTPEEVGIVLQDMSPEARHLFRVGAAQALKAKIADVVKTSDATKRLIDIQSLERKVKLVFGDNKIFQQYVNLLENEKEFFQAVTDVIGNTQIARKAANLDNLKADPGKIGEAIRNILDGNFTSAIKNLATRTKPRTKTMPEVEAEKIADVLTGRNIAGLEPIIPRVTETGQPITFPERLSEALALTAGSREE